MPARLAGRCPPPPLMTHADRSVSQVPCSTGGTSSWCPRGGSYSDCVGGGWWDHSVPSAWSRRINCCSIYAFVVGSVRQYLRS